LKIDFSRIDLQNKTIEVFAAINAAAINDLKFDKFLRCIIIYRMYGDRRFFYN